MPTSISQVSQCVFKHICELTEMHVCLYAALYGLVCYICMCQDVFVISWAQVCMRGYFTSRNRPAQQTICPESGLVLSVQDFQASGLLSLLCMRTRAVWY